MLQVLQSHPQCFPDFADKSAPTIYRGYSSEDWYRWYILLSAALQKEARTDEQASQAAKKSHRTVESSKKQDLPVVKPLFLNEGLGARVEQETENPELVSTYLEQTNDAYDVDLMPELTNEKLIALKIKHAEVLDRIQSKTLNLNLKIRESRFRKMSKREQSEILRVIGSKATVL